MKHMTAALLILLLMPTSHLPAAERARSQWTRQSVEAESVSFESALKELGLKAPMKRARELAAQEMDWEAAQVQRRWQSRIDYWRSVLLLEDAVMMQQNAAECQSTGNGTSLVPRLEQRYEIVERATSDA